MAAQRFDEEVYEREEHGIDELRSGVSILERYYRPVDMDRNFIDEVIKIAGESDEEVIGGLMDIIIRLQNWVNLRQDESEEQLTTPFSSHSTIMKLNSKVSSLHITTVYQRNKIATLERELQQKDKQIKLLNQKATVPERLNEHKEIEKYDNNVDNRMKENKNNVLDY